MSDMVGFILTIFNAALVIWCVLCCMEWQETHSSGSISTYLVPPALLILCAASSLGSVWFYYNWVI